VGKEAGWTDPEWEGEMSGKFLVAYATTHGSMAEIAEAVAGVLREHGVEVDVMKARDVHSLEGYSSVVLGAPLYMFRWHGDAFRFLNKHREAIENGLSVAVFGGGPFGEATPQVWQEVKENLDKELAKVAWFKPASVLVVGGKFDPQGLKFPYNLIPAMKQQPFSDLRNWEEIKTWAEGLVEGLGRKP